MPNSELTAVIGARGADEFPPGAATIERLLLSPDHNYFGHHGGPAGTSPVIEVAEIECVAGRGVRGDRFFDYRPDYKGQVTFFAMEVFERICIELGIRDVPATAVRRNVFTRGLDLNACVGREFVVQGVRFFGAEECRPCYWMEQAVGPGTEMRLRGCGGLRARILSDGPLRVGRAKVTFSPVTNP
jgi:MOSC domain-containing protein YiiM